MAYGDIENSGMSNNEKSVKCIEKNPKTDVDVNVGEFEKPTGVSGLLSRLASLGSVELRGSTPVPVEERTETEYSKIFSLWFCMSVNPLPITTGMVGTLSYGLSLRDSSLVILFFTLISTIPPAYFSTWGPKTGMRQLIQARFTFGKYFISIPILLNLATLTGFCVVDSVIGGQTLSAVTDGTTINATCGIVIIAIISLLISFCGFKVLHLYEKFAWIPALLAIIIATGCGGKHLKEQVQTEPAAAGTILSFGALVASFMLPWAALASDFSTYMHPKAPSLRIATYTYVGLALPTILLMVLGAAIGGAVPNVPSWMEGYETNAAGGILAAMLHPAGGFGRFVTVILSFSILGNISATMYSITLNLQMLIPWLFRIPRALFAIIITAIVIGVGIKAAVSFFTNLENFIGIIGYWAAAFIAVVTVEHLLFRRSNFNSYTEDEHAWNGASTLPPGFAAIAASILCFGLVIPSMAQVWYIGPIAETTGDIGFELALVVSALLYVPLRYTERKVCGR